jgi:polygalacturonase
MCDNVFADQLKKGTYLTGAFNLTSNMILKIDEGATILGSPDLVS